VFNSRIHCPPASPQSLPRGYSRNVSWYGRPNHHDEPHAPGVPLSGRCAAGSLVRRTAYDGPLSSASELDALGGPWTSHGAASLDRCQGRLCAAPGRLLRPHSSGAARGGLAFRASPRPPEGSLGGEDTTTIRALQRLTTALKAQRDVYVLRLQRWRRGWSRSLPAVDAKWLAGARDENRLDMIDRRRPRPWTHFPKHEIITEALLTIVGKCGLLVGYRGERRPTPVCLLTEARSRLRVGYEVLSDRTRLILTKR